MPCCMRKTGHGVDMRRINPVTAVFVLLSLIGLILSGMRPTFVLNEVIVRFIRDGVMVLALIIPITAGMGLNFAIVVGAMCALIGVLLFHSLFIVSPQAGQNVFGNPALGEYFRSFIAYGTIAFALVMNMRSRKPAMSVQPPSQIAGR